MRLLALVLCVALTASQARAAAIAPWQQHHQHDDDGALAVREEPNKDNNHNNDKDDDTSPNPHRRPGGNNNNNNNAPRGLKTWLECKMNRFPCTLGPDWHLDPDGSGYRADGTCRSQCADDENYKEWKCDVLAGRCVHVKLSKSQKATKKAQQKAAKEAAKGPKVTKSGKLPKNAHLTDMVGNII